jgi:hypothetical protein
MKDASNTFYVFSSACQGNVSLCHHLASVKKSANQKQEWPVVAMFVNGSEQNEQYL